MATDTANDVYGKSHPDGLMTVSQVARRLSTSCSFVYARLAEGSLRHFVLGPGQGAIRVSEEQLHAYLRAKERGS